MSRSAKCSVSGCPGVVTFDSDGRGAVKGECPCCEKREAWKLVNLPDVARLACAICSGQFVVRSKGRHAPHCPACTKLVRAKQQREYKANLRAPKARILKSA